MTLLVDSSVWIDRLRGVETRATRFIDLREHNEDIALTGTIFHEVLQGIRDDAGYERVREFLAAMRLLEPGGLATHDVAAQLYRRARRIGSTIRKPNDCLIAAVALEHGATLVHNDRDFLSLAEVEPALVTFPGRAH